MISKQQLQDAIRSLGLSGKNVWINSSMRSFGEPVEDGADGVIDAFLDEGCTVMTPTFTLFSHNVRPINPDMIPAQNAYSCMEYNFRRYGDARGKVFDPSTNETDANLGVFTQRLVAREGRCRGNHPLISNTAVGPNAAMLVRGQDRLHPYAPMQNLYDTDGWTLQLGVSMEKQTVIHLAETWLGKNPVLRWANMPNGKILPVKMSWCSDGFEVFEPYMKAFEKKITVGKSVWTCYPVRQLAETCYRLMKENPHIADAHRRGCAWCRDCERGGPLIDADFWTRYGEEAER